MGLKKLSLFGDDKMRHYINKSLVLQKAKENAGDLRGGSYVARVKTGVEKDGSPQYRYFRTQEEYNTYLSGGQEKREADAKKKKDSDSLKEKVKDEHKESKERSKESSEAGKHRLLQAEKANKKKKDDVEKSLFLCLIED